MSNFRQTLIYYMYVTDIRFVDFIELWRVFDYALIQNSIKCNNKINFISQACNIKIWKYE